MSPKSATYRDRHRALGLCLECPTVAKVNRTRCHACLVKRSACALRRLMRLTDTRDKAFSVQEIDL